VIALAQHLDDLAETLMMSMFFGGKLRTMSPHYLNDAATCASSGRLPMRASARPRLRPRLGPAGDLRELSGLLRKPQQRYAMKQMLAEQEKQHPRIFNSLLTAMRPLMGSRPPDFPQRAFARRIKPLF